MYTEPSKRRFPLTAVTADSSAGDIRASAVVGAVANNGATASTENPNLVDVDSTGVTPTTSTPKTSSWF